MSQPHRSKEDILSEIRRLQSQMAELEDRVSNSAKVMNGAGGMGAMAGGGPVGGVNVGLTSPTERTTTEVVISAAAVASNAGGSSEPTEKGNKDN